jgi:hypothetical protein
MTEGKAEFVRGEKDEIRLAAKRAQFKSKKEGNFFHKAIKCKMHRQ